MSKGERIYTFNELKESRLIYDRKPPAFGVIMTLLTLVFFVVAIVWSCLSVKTYVVKATGLVTSETKSNVMNSVAGEIKTIEVTEGQTVAQGDIIVKLDTFQTDLQIAQIQAMVDLYQGNVNNTQKLIAYVNAYSIEDSTTQVNPFDSSTIEEIRFYADAEMLKTYMQSAIEQGSYTEADMASLKTQFLTQQSVYTYLTEYLAQLKQYQSQLSTYQNSLEEYYVKATQSGVVHLTVGLAVGTVLSNSTLIATISNSDAEDYFFQLAVSATERSKLAIDSVVEIAVSGASQTEYGTLTGKIIQIDNDSTQTEDQVYYTVKVVPNGTKLTNKGGGTIDLTLGMVGECRIKYDETTYFKWMIEQVVGKLY